MKVEGLGQCPFIDTTQDDRPLSLQSDKSLGFNKEVDRIYPDSPSELVLVEGKNKLKISSEGFMDTVVWNPWVDKGGKLADMPSDGFQKMVCIEAAAIHKPVDLRPQNSWTGSQTLSI